MDAMEKAFIIKDVRSFECSSPSEFDRKLLEEQSLLSALSLEQLSASKALSDTAADGSNSRTSELASLCLSDTVSPCRGFPLHSSNIQEPDVCSLAVPLQGRFSTPHILLQKPRSAAGFDQSYSDLTASHVSWDVSLIKAESSTSPRMCMESSAQEQACSPQLQHSLAEASPDWLLAHSTWQPAGVEGRNRGAEL